MAQVGVTESDSSRLAASAATNTLISLASKVSQSDTDHVLSNSTTSASRFFWDLTSLSLWWTSKIVFFLPNSILSFLQMSFQVTLSLKWLLFLFIIIAGTASSVIRYKYLTVYSRLPEEPERQEPKIDVFLESRNQKKDSRFPNFLDGFLSAIKIFGYLDKNVFHELTKNMTTQKLELNETFLIDDNKGFSIVVEGTVQVYYKVGAESNTESLSADQPVDETMVIDGVKYQLLNTIKSGTTLSSLISILKILTRNFESTAESVEHPGSQQSNHSNINTRSFDRMGDLDSPSLSTFHLDGTPSPVIDNTTNDLESVLEKEPSAEAFLPSLIARASSNATIAIIPTDAFARLVEKHPRSVSHIVQMILTRLHRVTFQTAHTYLGLTEEIYKTEVNLNNDATYQLPSYLHDGVVQRLNQLSAVNGNNSTTASSAATSKTTRPTTGQSQVSFQDMTFVKDKSTNKSSSKTSTSIKSDDEIADESFISIPRISNKRKPSAANVLRNSKNNLSRHIILDSRNSSNPGDLLSNVPLSRKEMSYQPLASSNIDEEELLQRTFSADEETEDSSARTAIAESIFKLLGVDRSALEISLRASNTEASSPVLGVGTNSNALANINAILGSQNSRRRFSNVSSTLYPVLGFKSDSSVGGASDDDLSSLTGERPILDFENLKKELANKLEIMLVKKDTKIIREDHKTPGLYFVIDGILEVSNTNSSGQENKICTIKPGGVAGYLGTFICENSFITVTTLTNAYLAFIPRDDFERFIDKYCMLQLIIARNTVKFMGKELLLMDLALEWVQTQAGESLYDQGDPANGIYMVLNGRFRSVHESRPVTGKLKNGREEEEENKITVLSEFGQGESLGEVEVLTASERPTTMIAVRDSETARIPRTLFEILALSKPSIMIKVTRIVARKMKESTNGSIVTSPASNHKNPTISAAPSAFNSGHYKGSTNYRTITILPVRQGLPVIEFAQKLAAAFKACDRNVITLNQASTLSHLGRHAFDKLAKLKQSGFFADLEEKYDTVIYVTDTPVSSNWTRAAISQGDCILLIADAEAQPEVGDYERLLVKMKTTARTELILLHPERYVKPGQTSKWLKHRMWVHSHHHVQMLFKERFSNKATTDDIVSFIPFALKSSKVIQSSQAKIANIRSKVGNIIKDDILKMLPIIDTRFEENYYHPTQEHKSDFLRLARLLSGNSVGLVLGGGGSRGLSHIGIIKAIEESGIPIDMIGGTSIGSFIGGLYAKDYDIVPIFGRAKQFSGRIASFWRMLSDVTYPVTSYITGHEFNRGIWKAFGDSRIEDFWIQFFANSTNITNSVMEIHSSGYAWRYIRASMSLAGLLPPITDNGSMLLDGGYIDNLPVEEMRNRGASIIFAVDVGSVDDKTPLNYGDSLSGLWVLFNRWNPFSKHPNVPTMAEIQLRLTYVASVNALEKAKRTPGVIYLRPPIDDFSTLDFGKFQEIYNVGEAYGSMIFDELAKDGTLPAIKGISNTPKELSRKAIQRRNSI